MTVVAVYDANVLYPSLLRDVLIRVAIGGAVRAHWTERILDEVFRNIAAKRPDLDVDQLDRTRSLMNGAIRDVTVSDFEQVISGLELPDADDRHVLAAAIHAEADVIVTFNLKDFPVVALSPHGVTAQHPDAFLLERFEDNPASLTEVVRQISASTKNPHRTPTELIARLGVSGLPLLARRLRDSYGDPA